MWLINLDGKKGQSHLRCGIWADMDSILHPWGIKREPWINSQITLTSQPRGPITHIISIRIIKNSIPRPIDILYMYCTFEQRWLSSRTESNRIEHRTQLFCSRLDLIEPTEQRPCSTRFDKSSKMRFSSKTPVHLTSPFKYSQRRNVI